jgi:hypothetical protein
MESGRSEIGLVVIMCYQLVCSLCAVTINGIKKQGKCRSG